MEKQNNKSVADLLREAEKHSRKALFFAIVAILLAIGNFAIYGLQPFIRPCK